MIIDVIYALMQSDEMNDKYHGSVWATAAS